MTPTQTPPASRPFVTLLACAVAAALGCGGPAAREPGLGSEGAALAASGTLWGDNLTRPAGAVWLGTHLWFADNLEYFLRLDAAASGLQEPNQFYRATGVADAADASGPGPTHLFKAGQPAFDAARGLVYVPDFNSRTAGVWRFTYDAANERVLTVGAILAPGLGLAGLRPTSAALGPDGNLYIGSLNTPDVKRVNGPAGAQQTVQTIGKATGRRIFGLAFAGADLYLAESNGVSVIRNAAGCQSGCNAAPLAGVAAVETVGIATDGLDALYFTQAPNVLQYSLAAGSAAVFASAGTLPPGYTPLTSMFAQGVSGCTGSTCTFSFAPGQPNLLALDGGGHLIVGEDPGLLTPINPSPFCGRLWRF